MQLSHPKVENGFKHIPPQNLPPPGSSTLNIYKFHLCFEFTQFEKQQDEP
jgi:hypothetical protein